MHIFFDPEILPLRLSPTETKHQYIRICIKKECSCVSSVYILLLCSYLSVINILVFHKGKFNHLKFIKLPSKNIWWLLKTLIYNLKIWFSIHMRKYNKVCYADKITEYEIGDRSGRRQRGKLSTMFSYGGLRNLKSSLLYIIRTQYSIVFSLASHISMNW